MCYNRGMKDRTLHISTQDTSWGKAAGGKDKCMVRIMEGNRTRTAFCGVNYGIAITNIMEEWQCTRLEYSPKARIKFLGKKACNLQPQTV